MRTIVDLPQDNVDALKALSQHTRLSRAELVRRAVADYLNRHWTPREDTAFGIWKHRKIDGLEYQENLRSEWDE